ncbi:kinase C-like protein [Podospora australis]|uniref:Protein kinase C-like n=1 Tax=Podospora australis TaxID=1536484 RepID=A0AAN6WUB7_9PEZI|nr:kinase C-like protein [Podospora australis]
MSTSSGPLSEDEKIQDITKKIEREKALINAAHLMRQQTNNESVRSKLDTQMREGRRNLDFFEERLRELQMRRLGQSVDQMSIGGSTLGGSSFSSNEYPGDDGGRPAPPPKDASQYSNYGGQNVYGPRDLMPPRGPFPGQPPNSSIPKARPNFTKLDLIRYDTPHLGPRIQLMLSQIQFKLNVEEQYLKGIEKMVQLYGMEGDKKSKTDAISKRFESQQKMMLLKQALKRYEELHIDMDADGQDDDSINMPNMRKPISGNLDITIGQVKDVDHAPLGRFSRSPETFVNMKVEDIIIGRTKASRFDRWDCEFQDLFIEKAHEIELTVYDKPGEAAIPIALLWVRISDIIEAQRRKRIEAETNAQGWVSADRLGTNAPRVPPAQFPMGAQSPQFAGPPTSPGMQGPQAPDFLNQDPALPVPVMSTPVEGWFNLEPTGQIYLKLAFNKITNGPREAGLNRKGAVRQRKEEVHEMHGHKFVQKQFYNIMRCALCGEFLKYSAGMQCEDCKYTCHTKCYTSVVTKCISKSNAESDPDEEKLNHKIPHRFVAFSNLTANWCCHCGYMLPIGSKKNSRRCTECPLTAHAQCVHLVPDFCGMSMVAANQILDSIRQTKKIRQEKASSLSERTLRQGSKGTTSSAGSSSTYPPGSYAPSHASSEATEAAKHMYNQTSSQRPSGPDRTSTSSTAASAAAAAAMSPKPQTPTQQPMGQIPDFGPGHYGSPAGYGGRPTQPAEDLYGASPSQQQQPYGQQQQQQRKYNPADYANIGAYPVSPPAQARPVQAQSPPQQQQQQQQVPQQSMYQQQPQPISQQPPKQPPLPVQQVEPHNVVPSASGVPVATKKPLPSATDPGTGMRIGLDHFNFLAVLGKGNFGKVMLAETKRSRKLYAIKVLKKEFIIENDEVESIRSEKRVFLIANRERHPFLTNLHACFQTETRVYFVMEYISGGDLMLHIQRGQFGTKRAQFYAAEVCLALKYFHENGVIYRDLKLDNILLTLDGHIKIADYGLCKEDMWYGSTTSTFCGTPEFMAPEILLDKKYGRAVDWWAFGVLIYQMLLQQSPFRGEDEDEIYDAILADEPLYPIHMPRDSVSILQKLLTREPDQRLGSGPTDAQEVMSQPFFRNINWDDIYHKRVAPPFLPQIKSATDTSNFDSEFTSVTPVLTPVQSVLSQAMQEEFRGFSYTADFE